MSKVYLKDGVPEVWQMLSDARTTNSMILAALSLVAYDHLITLPDEVELMWKSDLCVSNAVYLWNRYFTLITLWQVARLLVRTPTPFDLLRHIQLRRNRYVRPVRVQCSTSSFTSSGARWGLIVHKACIRFFHSEAVMCTLILATVDFILVLRVWILYKKKWVLLYLLVPLIGLEIVTIQAVVHRAIVPRYFALYSVPVLIVSIIMFLMTVYKCGTTLFTHGRAQLPIYNMFLRDGVFWFVAIFATFIPEVIIWARGRLSLAELLIAPGLAVTSIIGSRVLLNIKALGRARTGRTLLPATTTESAFVPTVELDTIDYPSRIPWGTVGSVGTTHDTMIARTVTEHWQAEGESDGAA
ncbi:hypothetical protein GGX14DRAFT_620673 [Mycena pura]|uniref:DUF6533 domain-containing protein n=1 Tax=Mycena pura TaxID=153505 RepID=A0AAD6VKR7_9AGAR|nr:hypothetical protein GGX14DRAFT_620673 [Mycena pura]